MNNKKKLLEKTTKTNKKPPYPTPQKPRYFHIKKVLHQKSSIRKLNQWKFL